MATAVLEPIEVRYADEAPEEQQHQRVPLRTWQATGLAVLAAVPASIVLGYLSQLLVAEFVPPPGLEDARSSDLSYVGEWKTGEFLYPAIAFLLPMLAGWLVYLRSVRSPAQNATRQVYVVVLALCAFPALVPIVLNGVTAALTTLPTGPLAVAVLLQSGTVVMWLLHSVLGLRILSRSKYPRPLSHPAIVFLSAAVGLAGLGVARAVSEYSAPEIADFGRQFGIAVIFGTVISGVLAFGAISRPGRAPIYLTVVSSLLGIAALPLLWPPLLIFNGDHQWPPGTDLTMWRILTLALASVIATQAVWQLRRTGSRWPSAVSSLVLAIFIVSLRIDPALPLIPDDDYHFGEVFAPEMLWRDFGQQPYVDQEVVRGLIQNMLHQFFNGVFADGQASTFQYAVPLVALVAVAVSLALLRQVVGLPMAIVAVSCLGVANAVFEGDLVSLSVLFVILAVAVRRGPGIITGIALTMGSALVLLLYPMNGVATVILVGLVGAAGLLGALVQRRGARDWRSLLAMLAAIIASVAALALSPLRDYLWGSASYVFLNAGSSTEAFGVPLRWVLQMPLSSNTYLPFAFMLAIPASVLLGHAVFASGARRTWRGGVLVAIALIPLLWVAMFLGRYMGRLDASPWTSRATVGTLITLAVIVPTAAVLVGGARARRAAKSALILAAAISVAAIPIGAGSFLETAVHGIPAPPAWPSAGANSEVRALGMGQGNQDHLDDQRRIHRQAEAFPDGLPVLNMTDRGTLFAYHGWRNPLPMLAPYNITSAESEERAIAALSDDLPEYAILNVGLTQDARRYDGPLSPSLRNPELVQWVMDHYRPLQCSGSIWGISRESGTASPGLLTCNEAEQALTETELWSLSLGAPEDVGGLPGSWGRRITLDPQHWQPIPIVMDVRRPGGPTEFVVRTSTWRGTDLPGLLHLSLHCIDPGWSGDEVTGAPVAVTWETEEPMESAISRSQFAFTNDEFIVPLDAYPAWSQKRTATDITVNTGAPCLRGWILEAMAGTRG